MKNTSNPQNPYATAITISAITSCADKLSEAATEHLTNWLLTQDWGAVIDWCLIHAAALQQL